MLEHWSVTVEIDGESVLTLSSNGCSGLTDLSDYEQAIRDCAAHLLAFVGPAEPMPFFPE